MVTSSNFNNNAGGDDTPSFSDPEDFEDNVTDQGLHLNFWKLKILLQKYLINFILFN